MVLSRGYRGRPERCTAWRWHVLGSLSLGALGLGFAHRGHRVVEWFNVVTWDMLVATAAACTLIWHERGRECGMAWLPLMARGGNRGASRCWWLGLISWDLCEVRGSSPNICHYFK